MTREELRSVLNGHETVQEALDSLRTCNINLSEEELKTYFARANAEELNEALLEDVVGGAATVNLDWLWKLLGRSNGGGHRF